MPTVWIPALLRDVTGGRETVTVAGATVGEVIESLEKSYPGVRARLCDAGGLKKGIAVAVDTQVSRLGLREPVKDLSEIHFLPAISGGQTSGELAPGK
jgi:molybdopterin converting factor small subunit